MDNPRRIASGIDGLDRAIDGLRGGDTGARDPGQDNLTEYTLLYGSLLG